MKAIVTLLYKDGKRIPHKQGKPDPTFTGELDLHYWLHPVLQRNVAEMALINPSGLHEIPSLLDSVCIAIGGHGMTFRGIEYGAGAREVAQEWYIRMGG